MRNENETPENRRESLRQKELSNPSSSVHGSNLADLVGGLGRKGIGIFILLIIAGLIIYSLFFQ
ncbi:hypothetical protein J0K78_03825 [Halobacillus sp. GSS1]|uniref:DUF6366 family protein n=1 Tax=Halobacillus sp. GSS1 TaxID=2815919 RepID=UPI001A8FE7E5|nr:DUF6366 family protein [Halobacillus sp. GSS1]MBN9653385.1 hypothetical protein [Halobacillus sp. GSS1]